MSTDAKNIVGPGKMTFSGLVEILPEALVVSDGEGRIELVNSHAEDLFGYSRAELQGKNIGELMAERFSRKRVVLETEKLVRPHRKATAIKLHLRGRHRNGAEFPVEIKKKKVRTADGERFVSTIRSLEEGGLREENFDATVKELMDFKAALDHHSILAITDTQGRITYVNDKFCQVSKYSRAELLGQNHRILNSGLHSKEFFQGLWTTIVGGEIWQGEICNRAKDGTLYWVDATIVPFLGKGCKPTQYVSIRTEITGRKLAEQDRERLIGELRSALTEVRTLSGMLPICANCKRIRDDKGYWNQIEAYISAHTSAQFTHGYCPSCAVKMYQAAGLEVPEELSKEADKHSRREPPGFRSQPGGYSPPGSIV